MAVHVITGGTVPLLQLTRILEKLFCMEIFQQAMPRVPAKEGEREGGEGGMDLKERERC